MTKQIVWSPLSEKDMDGILNYLYSNWDKKVAFHFVVLTQNILQQIATSPKQFPYIRKNKRVRKCVLTKHNTLFYRENRTQIAILRIYDTRQNPVQLSFK
jgi:plasmid stabilization system protein ParE